LASICKHAGFEQVSTKPFGGLWERWAYELPRGLSLFPAAGLRSKKPQALGIALLPAKVAALGLIRALQMVFLRLDAFDAVKDDPLGWACEARKAW